jgi:hypothetical protein
MIQKGPYGPFAILWLVFSVVSPHLEIHHPSDYDHLVAVESRS